MAETATLPETEQKPSSTDPYTQMLMGDIKPIEQLVNNENVPRETNEGGTPNEQQPNNEGNTTPQFDPAKWLEEQSEGKVKTIDEFKGLLNKEPEIQVQQPQFSNEQSKLMYEALINGKEEEVYGYLAKKNVATTLANKPADEVVKAYIKEQYPSFNEAERDYFFNKEFGFNEEAFEDDELGLSVEKKKSEAKLERVKSEAIAYFNKQVSDIQLPKFEQPLPESKALDLDSEDAKKVSSFTESLFKNGYSIEANEIPYEYSNKENGADVKGKITLDEKAILQVEENIGAAPDVYWAKRYIKNGEFDSVGFSRDQYVLSNLPKLLQAATAEGFNKGFLHKVMKDKNITPTNMPSGETADVDAIRQKAEDYKYRGFSDEAIFKITGIDLRSK